jgi:hypothetical protein
VKCSSKNYDTKNKVHHFPLLLADCSVVFDLHAVPYRGSLANPRSVSLSSQKRGHIPTIHLRKNIP